jgi:Tfp pilus assembly protein PilO
MTRSSRTQHWRIDAAGLALIFGLAAAAYFVQISPTIAEDNRVRADAMQAASERAKARDLERSLLTLNEQVDKTQRAAASSQLALEPASQLNQRLARLTELAAQNSLQVDAIESGATTMQPRYSTVSIRITGRGTYRNCGMAMKQLRVSMPDIAIVSFQMSSAGIASGNTDTIVTFGFDLLWHTQPQVNPVKK